jgi:tight adherence protein B
MKLMLVLAAFALLGMAASFFSLQRARAELDARTQRVNAVIGPHRATWTETVATTGIGRVGEERTIGSMILALLQHNPRRQMYYPLPLPAVLVLATVLGFLFGFAGSQFFGPPGWLVAPACAIWFSRAFHNWAEDGTQRQLYIQFPDALATVVRSVRVGLPVVEAMRIVARESPQPTAREFTYLVEQTNIGVPLDEALRDMGGRNGLPEYRFFATALSLQSQTGGALSETLDNLAETIKKRVAIRMRGHALASEARMSAYILGALPIVTGGLLGMVNPKYIMVLFIDPGGRNLLFAGIIMLTLGGITMRTIIRRSLS